MEAPNLLPRDVTDPVATDLIGETKKDAKLISAFSHAASPVNKCAGLQEIGLSYRR